MRIKSICYPNITKNQQGFAFPFLLLLTALLLMVISYSLSVYKSTIEMSRYHEETIIRDSLYQTAGEKLKIDLPEISWKNSVAEVVYQLPDGKVTVSLNQRENQQAECHFRIEPAYGSPKTIYKLVTIP